MKRPVRISAIILLVLIFIAALAFFILPPFAEKLFNRLVPSTPFRPSPAVAALHKTLLIADMHSDFLLWDRDLLKRNSYGHIDVPRLIEGNVALQAFTIVTHIPSGVNFDRNDGKSNLISILVPVQLWPVKTWASLKERALYQAERLRKFEATSGGKLTIIRSAADLKAFLERHKKDPAMIAGLLGIEGVQALEGDPANLDEFFRAGVRMVGLAHFYDNEFAGSAHGVKKGGLTEKGRDLVRRMEAKHVILDLAHISPVAFDDAIRIVKRPVLVSHTGVKGTCDNRRNLSDAQLRAIARTGGVVCIGYWDGAVCGTDPAAIVRAIAYAVKIAGVRHVGLGSDYEGGTIVPFDASGFAELTAALMKEGFREPDIRLIMGGNVIRMLEETLP